MNKNNFLCNILKYKKIWLEKQKIMRPYSSFKNNLIISQNNFYKSLKKKIF
ncbi:hypothetical protein RJX39_01035 [Buchnera aphidicola (Taiwanaphis decaspermi)]